jgi:Activator of Hsp90 ATPase homolog 1-like protein
MAQNDIIARARPDAVWDTLMTAGAYEHWVVGCKRIRGVDASWPQPGSAFHHSVGFGPITIRDKTQVEVFEPPTRLVLLAHAWPAGQARVEVLLRPVQEHTAITMTEQPVSGPAALLSSSALDLATHLRNDVALHRLRRLVESRAPEPSPTAADVAGPGSSAAP